MLASETLGRLRVFLSHSHHDARIARDLRAALSQYRFRVFVAHEDIRPSAEWQQTILKELRRCDIFIPILTTHFRSSFWTDQETGIAVDREVIILPLKIDIDPYGFIAKYQAFKLRKSISEESSWSIVKALAGHPAVASGIRDQVIHVAMDSNTFDEAAANVKRLVTLGPFSTTQVRTIFRGAADKRNIYGCFKARPYLEELIAGNQSKIGHELVAAYRESVRSWGG
jgi:hypothetical protein